MRYLLTQSACPAGRVQHSTAGATVPIHTLQLAALARSSARYASISVMLHKLLVANPNESVALRNGCSTGTSTAAILQEHANAYAQKQLEGARKCCEHVCLRRASVLAQMHLPLLAVYTLCVRCIYYVRWHTTDRDRWQLYAMSPQSGMRKLMHALYVKLHAAQAALTSRLCNNEHHAAQSFVQTCAVPMPL
eukprot:12714-Heterococcus_DN1.PRE.1